MPSNILGGLKPFVYLSDLDPDNKTAFFGAAQNFLEIKVAAFCQETIVIKRLYQFMHKKDLEEATRRTHQGEAN